MKLNWNFLEGEEVQNKELSVGEVLLFSGAAQKEGSGLKTWDLVSQADRIRISNFLSDWGSTCATFVNHKIKF